MNQRLIAGIGKSQRLRIVNQLKRTQGLSVGELSELLGMSYMGVREHCVDLEKRGYLDTFRRPKAPGQTGRPEMVYRLTQKTHELFPATGNEMTLEVLRSSQALYGASAPEKLLYLVFQTMTERYLARAKGETATERAKWLTRLRDSEGHMSEFETDEHGLRIVEHHSPITGLMAAYPTLIARLEQEMFAKVLKAPVTRELMVLSGLYCCTFQIGMQPSTASATNAAAQGHPHGHLNQSSSASGQGW